MKPKINKTSFGSITVNGEKLENDILIRLDGSVVKRRKKLSKEVFGTSHTLSLAEAEFIYEKGAEKIVIGSGQSGMLKLSEEAEDYFSKRKCKVKLIPTPEAITSWNKAKGKTIGLFHVTC
ncbi:MAG: hypothetical protein C3F13_00045 [Anaerolineales bacterium]|nr:hypothetical protein [Anaerolineae bacterium]PWB56853.1 MAG: hypothetical protein C3F13_00045 [Anaerolineales bacterium]